MKKVLYEIKKIILICVTLDITGKNDKMSTRMIQTLTVKFLYWQAEKLP